MRTQVHTLPATNRSQAVLEPHSGIVEDADSQLPLGFYAPAPDPAGHAWRAFTLDTAAEDAAAAFQRRYGRQPEYLFESRGILLAGPIPAEVGP